MNNFLLLFGFIFLFVTTLLADDLVATTDRATVTPHKITAYVVDWEIPRSIPWHKLDHINYAFAVPDRLGKLTQFNANQLKLVVSDAHHNNKSISLSIGGWTGSLYFSSLIRNEASRQSFTNNIVQKVKEYDLDGIDIDWEYPNSPNGISCNQNNPQDTPNFLKFVQLLRSKLDANFPKNRKQITSAVSTLVFNNEKQVPFEYLDPAWATAFDAIQIMGYDLNGFHNNYTGANAPLYYSGANHEPTVSLATHLWHKAGIPFEKMILGVPFFGYTTLVKEPIDTVDEDHQVFLIDHSQPQIQADKYDTLAADPCPNATKKSYSGEMQWRSIQESISNINQWQIFFDQDTVTPFAYNKQKKQFLSFDDPESMKAKVDYVKRYRLGGVMFWSLEMDDKDHTLLNALQDIYEDY